MTEDSDFHPTVHYLARRYEADECDREREFFRWHTVNIPLPYSTVYDGTTFEPNYPISTFMLGVREKRVIFAFSTTTVTTLLWKTY